MPVKPHPTDPDKMSVEWSPEEDEAFNEVEKQSNLKSKQGVAEGSGKNVVKSVKVGNFRHDLVNTGMGWQVRIYNGDELYDTGLSKNSEEKGLAALDNSVAYTKKQLNIKEQSVAEGAPELLKAEMPLVRHIERELTQHGYEKGTSEYNEHFKHALAYYRKFGNIDAIKKGVAEGSLNESVIRSETIGPYTHELHKTPWGYQVRVYAGGKQVHSDITKPTEEKGQKSFDSNIAYTKKQLRINEQGVAEGTSNDYFKRRKDEEERIAGTKAPAKRTPKQTDYEKKRKEQGVAEASSPAQQAAIAIAKKKKAGVKESIAEDHSTATGGWGQGSYNTASKDTSKWAGAGHDDAVRENPEWYNDEANSMTTSQLKSLVKHAAKLRHAVKQMQAQGDTLEPWQQSKVTKAADYLDAVFNAVDDEHDMGESEDHPDEKEDKALIRKMVKQQALKQEDSYMEALSAKLSEKLRPNDPVDKYINDFSKAAKTPNAKGHHQFKNKSPEKVRQMAIAASYGAKNKSKKK